MLEKLTILLASQKPVKTIAGDDAYFGPPEAPVQVTILRNNLELQTLHNNIVDLLKSANAVFNTPQYTGRGYVPHCTVQKHARLHKGDVVKIDELAIIDMFPHGDGHRRRLLKTIKLGG